jgi:hypothetical protein
VDTGPDTTYAPSSAFFCARREGGRITVRGTGELRCGHTIESTWGDRSEGLYCEWRWDGERLRALTDPLGFFPLFYHANGSSVMVSPSLETLLQNGAPAELDAVALGAFTAFGFFLGKTRHLHRSRYFPRRGGWSGTGNCA